MDAKKIPEACEESEEGKQSQGSFTDSPEPLLLLNPLLNSHICLGSKVQGQKEIMISQYVLLVLKEEN